MCVSRQHIYEIIKLPHIRDLHTCVSVCLCLCCCMFVWKHWCWLKRQAIFPPILWLSIRYICSPLLCWQREEADFHIYTINALHVKDCVCFILHLVWVCVCVCGSSAGMCYIKCECFCVRWFSWELLPFCGAWNQQYELRLHRATWLNYEDQLIILFLSVRWTCQALIWSLCS